MLKSFKKILIANRGEIACRIIKTAHKMGISCVCVYSDADSRSLHVSKADEAVYIGASPAAQSYLNIQKICEAAVASGCQAVHPGYGFLSENPLFPKVLAKHHIDFIGPSSKVIEMMGDKVISKRIATEAGVNTVPGYMDIVHSASQALEIAENMGFPVMIKATSGGGGKGMRIVYSKAEVNQAFESSTNEAVKNFKDGRIFIEKYIESPRHIEIQILADQFGNVVCLGERECSIQRNNQKVIEESPSPFLNPTTRNKMYQQCIKLAKHVGYFSAGTVEFIVDQNQNFYFLEMNTRLQVEHPVTEFVTGIDLVEEMIRIAHGEKLRCSQQEVNLKGAAIEVRIYAEDPTKNFLPSAGRINLYNEPIRSPNVRIDTGVFAGAEISVFYDPMIAKLITYGNNRLAAIELMQKALNEFNVIGVASNIDFLESVFRHPKFIAGDINTNFISQHYPGGFHFDISTEECRIMFLLTSAYLHLNDRVLLNPKNKSERIEISLVVFIDEYESMLHIKYENHILTTIHNHNMFEVTGCWLAGYSLFKLEVNSLAYFIKVERIGSKYALRYSGMRALCFVYESHIASLVGIMPKPATNKKIPHIESPISGMVVKVHVAVGDEVQAGYPVFIIEAMKMENVVCAEYNAIVKAIFVKEGSSVLSGDLLIELSDVEN